MTKPKVWYAAVGTGLSFSLLLAALVHGAFTAVVLSRDREYAKVRHNFCCRARLPFKFSCFRYDQTNCTFYLFPVSSCIFFFHCMRDCIYKSMLVVLQFSIKTREYILEFFFFCELDVVFYETS